MALAELGPTSHRIQGKSCPEVKQSASSPRKPSTIIKEATATKKATTSKQFDIPEDAASQEGTGISGSGSHDDYEEDEKYEEEQGVREGRKRRFGTRGFTGMKRRKH
ncbi:uncharacterized protein E0L32_007507 [Thyridium curvatum]|uniref:Uncharacterized protein n=1 Tax=Thyridium curvatum TaxID=1093900 RepID=A0A507B577_9PEZI|nr:uncharacterized protein E0L32_007507 [Thyridium curvatum]TPX11770.1 hypothetical protein E0L32_007507 [Thyridium curvatum]